MKKTTDIIDEVKQDISSERTINIIRNYGKHIVATIALFIIAFSIYIHFNDRAVDKQKDLAEEYQAIFLNSSPTMAQKETIEKFIKKTDNNIFEYLATFQYANILAKNNQSNKAAELLLSLSEKKKFTEMSNLALVHASEIIITKSSAGYRDKAISLLSSRVGGNNDKTPHFYIMQIMLAQLMIEKDELKSAQEILKQMNNNATLPQNIKLLKNMLSNTIFTKKHE